LTETGEVATWPGSPKARGERLSCPDPLGSDIIQDYPLSALKNAMKSMKQ
jgi:hypothetical protein